MVPLYSSKITRVPLYSRKFISVTSKGLSPALVSFSKLFKLTYKFPEESTVNIGVQLESGSTKEFERNAEYRRRTCAVYFELIGAGGGRGLWEK